MSGLRFKAGDLARIVVTSNPANVERVIEIRFVGPWKAGECVQVSQFLFVDISEDTDYLFDGLIQGGWPSILDWRLAPLHQPDEPLSLTRTTQVYA